LKEISYAAGEIARFEIAQLDPEEENFILASDGQSFRTEAVRLLFETTRDVLPTVRRASIEKASTTYLIRLGPISSFAALTECLSSSPRRAGVLRKKLGAAPVRDFVANPVKSWVLVSPYPSHFQPDFTHLAQFGRSSPHLIFLVLY
jgi:hypothetical protein